MSAKWWDNEEETQQKCKEAKGQEPRILESKNSDEPSCPVCSGYNAMLHFLYYDGVTSVKCRDCGYTIVNVKVVYNKGE